MPLSWNEIRARALAFAKEWADETSEDAEAKSFCDGFFAIYGLTRRRVASFEEPVRKSDGKGGYIDLLKAHQRLDRAVDAAYGAKAFKSEAERVAFLFQRYQELILLLPRPLPGKRSRTAAKATTNDH